MNKKICVQCSKENEEHFTYCKNCGAVLPVVDRRPFAPPPLYSDVADKQQETYQDEFDGVSREQMGLYIGKNSDVILQKFDRMQAEGSCICWCASAFVLGLCFGFFGIAMWYFARKMTKAGLVNCALGVIAILLGGYFALILPAAADGRLSLISDLLMSVLVQPQNYAAVFLYLITSYPVFGMLALLSNLAVPALSALLVLHFYRKKALRDIVRINAAYPDDQVGLKYALKKKGGRSAVRSVIPVLILAVVLSAAMVMLTI